MFENLKKLIEYALFPPGIIIIGFLAAGFLARKIKHAFAVSLFFAAAIYAFSIGPVKNILIFPLENSYYTPKNVKALKAKAIVVLGKGAYNGVMLDGDSLNRLVGGFILYRKLHIPIIFSGGYSTSTVATSIIARKILLKMGVGRSDIITDDKSNDTAQNALDTEAICKKHKFTKIILVTSAYHMKRAVFLFRRTGTAAGLKIIPYPVDFKGNNHYNFYSFLPSMGNLTISVEAVHEYLGYGWARVK
ncbi:MAG: YdcF family protein [Burkholderiales bacterium]